MQWFSLFADEDEAAVLEYFNLEHSLANLQQRWMQDPTFKSLVPSIPGIKFDIVMSLR